MPELLRSRGLALTVLTIFLLTQPAVGCSALCLFESHGAHAMAGMGGAKGTVGAPACHAAPGGAVQHSQINLPSPVDTARPPVIAMAPAQRVEPAQSLPIPPRPIARTVDPPPPRLV